MNRLPPWTRDGWVGACAADALQAQRWLAAADAGGGRRSRHARCVQIEAAFVKTYPAAGDKALNAWRMGDALRAAGFAVPVVLLVATKPSGCSKRGMPLVDLCDRAVIGLFLRVNRTHTATGPTGLRFLTRSLRARISVVALHGTQGG